MLSRRYLLTVGLVSCAGLVAAAAAPSAEQDEALGFERTPPRLAFIDGEVSFLRAGAADWAPALANTPLAPGDELFTASEANLEIQVGPRAYVRAGEDTQLGLVNLEPDFLQLRITSGVASLDLRSLSASQTFELDTPNAAFTIERTGYYRVEVEGESTRFTSRRGGRAAVTPASGASAAIEPSEQVVVTGTDAPVLESYAAPELDSWDRWNYARTDDQLDAVSARYVAPGVYGVADLDHHGDWRLVATYGPVWVPRGVPVGWVPYSTGRWIFDPFYGWTWVDDAPWGWAPYHYGRWVHVSGYWGWAPGPVVAVRPYYAPALVAFFGGGGFSVGITIGTPYVGWVALGWGEPLIPWWGPVGFRGTPHWARWNGPRVVNHVVVKRSTVVRSSDIRVYDNARDRKAIVTVPRDRFGRRSAAPVRFARGDVARLEPVRGALGVEPDRSSLAPTPERAVRRPRPEVVERRVVATRAPRQGAGEARPSASPPVRVVEPPREGRRVVARERSPFGRKGEAERAISPPPPRFEEVRREQGRAVGGAEHRSEQVPAPPRAVERSQPRAPREAAPEARPAPPARGREMVAEPRAPRELPGEPANRVWRGHSGGSSREAKRAAPARPAQSPVAPGEKAGKEKGSEPRRGGTPGGGHR